MTQKRVDVLQVDVLQVDVLQVGVRNDEVQGWEGVRGCFMI